MKPKTIYIEPIPEDVKGKYYAEYCTEETEFKYVKYMREDLVSTAIEEAKNENVDIDNLDFDEVIFYVEEKGFLVFKENPITQHLFEKLEATSTEFSLIETMALERTIEFLQKQNPQELIDFIDNYK